MKAIVGLGNPGTRYRRTRHNIGWQVLDQLASRWSGGQRSMPEHARHAEILRHVVEGEPILLVKPLTFMNESGKTVRALVQRDHITPEDILVVHDDLDLALGRLRVRAQGSSGGHGGIKSIQQHLARVRSVTRHEASVMEAAGEAAVPGASSRAQPVPSSSPAGPSFPRIKVGVGRPPAGVDPIDFVLGTFAPEELPLIQPATELAADACEYWLREGTVAAMNRFNGK